VVLLVKPLVEPPPRGVLRGAYGLAFPGLVTESLDAAEAGWPVWDARWSRPDVDGPASDEDPRLDGATRRDRADCPRLDMVLGANRGEHVDEHYARLTVEPNGMAWLDRAAQRTTWFLPEPPSALAIAHPLLASTAVVAGHWLGRAPMHAGAFAIDGRVWGVLGGRGAGKTSALLGLHRAGVPVVTDDVLVVDGDIAYSGPRCLDLRRDAAERFGCGEDLGVVGRRRRWRVALPPVPGALSFAGWVTLGWADTVAVRPLSATERLATLAANRGLTAPGIPVHGLLDLVARPSVGFDRPRDWSGFADALALLVDALAAM